MTWDARILLLIVVVSGIGAAAAALLARRAQARFWRRLLIGAAAFLGAIFTVFAWGRLVEPAWVVTTNTHVSWPGPRMRVAVIGDFHAGRIGADVVARAVRRSNEADPDLVLLAGDYVTGYDLSKEKATILEELRPLRARRGVLAVLGNHDSEPYVSKDPRSGDIARLLEGMGFTVLRNRWTEVASGVVVVGLDEVQSGNIDAAKAFRGVPEGAARIALTHDWHGLTAAGVDRFDLAVTGHTHGGQICLPLSGWCPFARNNLPYLEGLHAWPAGGQLFVTRGIGESAVLMRLACRPEVALLELAPR